MGGAVRAAGDVRLEAGPARSRRRARRGARGGDEGEGIDVRDGGGDAQGERDAGGDVHEPALDGRARAISDRRGDGGRGDVREGVLVDAGRDRGAVRRSGDAGVL